MKLAHVILLKLGTVGASYILGESATSPILSSTSNFMFLHEEVDHVQHVSDPAQASNAGHNRKLTYSMDDSELGKVLKDLMARKVKLKALWLMLT